MIFTIGNRVSYLAAIKENGTIQKLGRGDCPEPDYPGGYAFMTAEDAQQRIDEAYSDRGFAVFGIMADWETGTYPNPEGGWWHNLLVHAEIIVLED